MKKIIEVSIGIVFSVLIIISGVMIMLNADKIVSNGDMSPASSVKIVAYGAIALGSIALIVSVAGSIHPLGHKLTQTVITSLTMVAAMAFISIYGMSLIVKPKDAAGYLTTVPQTSSAGTSVPAGKLPIELLIGILGGALGAISLVAFKMFFGGIVVKVSSFSAEEFTKLKGEAEEMDDKFKAFSKQFSTINFEGIENMNEVKVKINHKIEVNEKNIKEHINEIKQAEKSIEELNTLIKNTEVKKVVDSKNESPKNTKKTKENKENQPSEEAGNNTVKPEMTKQVADAKAKIEHDYVVIAKRQKEIVKEINSLEVEIAKISDLVSQKPTSKDAQKKSELSNEDAQNGKKNISEKQPKQDKQLKQKETKNKVKGS